MDNNKDEKILNKHTNLCIFNGNRRMIKRPTMEKRLLNHNVFDC